MSTVILRTVDSDFAPVQNSEAVLRSAVRVAAEFVHQEDGSWKAEHVPPGSTVLEVSAPDYQRESMHLRIRDNVQQILIGLRRPGQLSYRVGDEVRSFTPVEDQLLLIVQGNGAAGAAKKLEATPLSTSRGLPKVAPSENEAIVRMGGGVERVQQAAGELRNEGLQVNIARIIEHAGRHPTPLINELIVRFADDVTRAEAEQIAHVHRLRIAREVRHAGNAFLLVRDGEPTYDILNAAASLRATGRVMYAEPNIVHVLTSDQCIPNGPLWTQLPHLKLIKADYAWDRLSHVTPIVRYGSPAITIGIIDRNGVTPNHPDLTATLTDGVAKLYSDIDFTKVPITDQTVGGLVGDHGTSCAASACAAFNETRGMPGVAPNCHLIGAQIATIVTPVAMADIYMWMAGFWNGSTEEGFPPKPVRPADVISTSFGDNGASLSDTIRDLFDYLTTHGRRGKGIVLCFSVGNIGYFDFTNPADSSNYRAWPTYAKTLAVGSSINSNPTNPIPTSLFADPDGNTQNIATTVDTRALYSPYGSTLLRKPDLVSPSHTAYDETEAMIDPILSAVRVGTGNISGCTGGVVMRRL
jgi:Subtilase family